MSTDLPSTDEFEKTFEQNKDVQELAQAANALGTPAYEYLCRVFMGKPEYDYQKQHKAERVLKLIGEPALAGIRKFALQDPHSFLPFLSEIGAPAFVVLKEMYDARDPQQSSLKYIEVLVKMGEQAEPILRSAFFDQEQELKDRLTALKGITHKDDEIKTELLKLAHDSAIKGYDKSNIYNALLLFEGLDVLDALIRIPADLHAYFPESGMLRYFSEHYDEQLFADYYKNADPTLRIRLAIIFVLMGEKAANLTKRLFEEKDKDLTLLIMARIRRHRSQDADSFLDRHGFPMNKVQSKYDSDEFWHLALPEGDSLSTILVNELVTLVEHEDPEIREAAMITIVETKPLPFAQTTEALKSPDYRVKVIAMDALRNGEPKQVIPFFGSLIQDHSNEIRSILLSYFFENLSPEAIPFIIEMLEDTNGMVVERIFKEFEDYESSMYWNQDAETLWKFWKLALGYVFQRIIRQEDSVREQKRFSSVITARFLELIVKNNPSMLGESIKGLADLAFEQDSDTWIRAVDTARALNKSLFASAVQEASAGRTRELERIISRLGGEEASAYFSKASYDLSAQTLGEYRQPLLDLEKTSRQRWEDLTKQSSRSLYISTAMSISLFVIGTVIIIWGMVLLTISRDPAQKVTGGLVSALVGVATAYSGKFWKDPVENIQKFTSQQARIQAAFIAFMNRVSQIRLVFENEFTSQKIDLGSLERYQKLLADLTEQTGKNLNDQK